jgi:hypothetical protein
MLRTINLPNEEGNDVSQHDLHVAVAFQLGMNTIMIED